MRLKNLISVSALLVTVVAATHASAGWSPWDNSNWSGSNTPWSGNNMPWSGGNTPWGGNNMPWSSNNTPWGDNNWGPWGNNRSRSSYYGYNRNYYQGYNPNYYNRSYYQGYNPNYYRGYPKRKKKNDWMPWDNGPFGDISGPWDSGPWNPDWLDGRWSGDDVFGAGPDGWSDPNDPKGSMSRFWDDMLKAPYEFGEMPGGWTAPSISVPNPVEVGDEFEGSSRLAPKEAAEQMNNFEMN